jgi:hypothetical protein
MNALGLNPKCSQGKTESGPGPKRVGKQGDGAFSVARLAAIVIRGGNCFPFFGLQRLNRPADSEF